MTKRFILIYVLVAIFLVGCKDKQQVIINESENLEQENNVDESKSTLPKRPPEISFSDSSRLTPLIMYSSCWNKEDCSPMLKNPEEVTKDEIAHGVTVGQSLTIKATNSLVEGSAPIYPDEIEVTQLHKGVETKVEVSDSLQITAPTEIGYYYYNVNAKWENEIKGEANYAIKLVVRK